MELDDAYANGAYIDGAEAYPPRWAAEAAAFRARLGARAALGIPYGAGARQVFDLFEPDQKPRGTMVFVHGGYWRAFDRSSWSHLAAGAIARGWRVAMPSYDLCPEASIAGITRQIAAAVTAIAGQTTGRVTLAGHSAGGHLVARMLDPSVLPDAVGARLGAVVSISPLSDLRPLNKTSMNADFGLDMASAMAESPVLMTDRRDVPVTVWVGADERPAFLDQARWLADAWRCDHVVADGRHHFNVIDDLAEPASDMVRRLTA